jgi:hypothetical protein
MKIIVFALTFNCRDVLPFFLRHYETFADEISVWDDGSDDGTRELLKAHPKVFMREWPHRTGIDEDLFLAHWQEWYPKARGAFDWVMIPDPDEFIYSPDMLGLLALARSAGIEVIKPHGFNLVGDNFPKDDGHSQIYELNPMGVRAPVYGKPVIFQPHIKINWIRGKHDLEHCDPVVGRETGLKLLHARYMGAEYTRAKNAKNYARCGLLSGDKGAAWSCSPGYDGPEKEHSPTWADAVRARAVNVLKL